MKGAMILTISALLTKILSALYRVPFQNIVGDVGFYIYQQIYPIYGIVLALSTYGFPVIVSRMIAEKEGDHESVEVTTIIRSSFSFLLIISFIWFLLLFFGAPYLASMMGDEQLAPLIKVISVSFLILPFTSILRGIYQGKEDMLPTAVSQVTEQFIRVATILVFSTWLVYGGYSLYTVSLGALFGSLTGGMAGIFVLISFVWVRKDQLGTSFQSQKYSQMIKIWKTLFFQGTAICISGMLLVLLQFIDSLNVYMLLTQQGMEEELAKKLKGVYDRGQPFVQLGTVVATSLSLTLVPMITSAYKKKKLDLVKEKTQLALKVSLFVGFAASIGIMNIIVPMNTMLFKNAEGSGVIAVFCLAIMFSSMIITISGIFHGIGDIYYPAIVILSGVILKFILNLLLVPLLTTMGASVATILALTVITILLIKKLRHHFGFRLVDWDLYRKMVIAGAAMTIFLQLWCSLYFVTIEQGFHERTMAAIFSLTGVSAGAMVYIYITLKRNVFTYKELSILPFGEKLMSISKRMK
ncbi:putative polysaccharide biosynthesis protein [Bacillus pakistanensis]|nr:polysaccharide biosynthesis protein [Bacillus pakistanensis]